jgi:hypothetical protein
MAITIACTTCGANLKAPDTGRTLRICRGSNYYPKGAFRDVFGRFGITRRIAEMPCFSGFSRVFLGKLESDKKA